MNRKQVTILGASNLTRGISCVVETARLILGSPIDYYICMGHGRSYGMTSRVMGRALPGILDCGIWRSLYDNPDSSHALITDIGNDIIYGVSVETLVEWVDECIQRLKQKDIRPTITLPPVKSISKMKRWQYAVVKNTMYPTRKLSFNQAVSSVQALHDQLNDLADNRNVCAIDPREEWYGFDPIHIRPLRKAAAWHETLGQAFDAKSNTTQIPRPSLSRWLKLRTVTPESWFLLGLNLGRSQPSAQMEDGSTISLF